MRQLIVPSSFFPAIGGAQGSLLNFIYIGKHRNRPVLLLGIRGFIFSLFKPKKFIPLPFPYFLVKKIPIVGVFYTWLVYRFFGINTVFLYGGGGTAAILLKYRRFFKNTKFIIRSAGEDIQSDDVVNYGFTKKKSELIIEHYRNCDVAWALSSEISDIYKQKCKIPIEKITVCPNAIIQPTSTQNKICLDDAKALRIGVIGRNHPKKQFNLAYKVAEANPGYDFIFKTPGFLPKPIENTTILRPSKIKDLVMWPQVDVHEFYKSIDVLLVCSRVESFGNINFEAAVNGVPVLIHVEVTGGEILEEMGYQVFFYDSFDENTISTKLREIEIILRESTYETPPYDNSLVKKMAAL